MPAAARADVLPAPQPEPEGLRLLLSRLAEESGDLAEAADGLQVLFGRLMADPPEPPADALEQAQALDALVQRLQGLQLFLCGLSEAPLFDLEGDADEAARRMRLTGQARRFSPHGSGGWEDAASGDCDLF